MFFSVREMELHKVPFDVEIAPGTIEFDDGLKQASPIRTSGVAELVSPNLNEIRVRGKLAVLMTAECDRCLEPAEWPLDAKFDLFYESGESASGAEDRHLADDETELGFYEGEGLALEEVLKEQVILALPMQRVCRPDCKGMCPVCGQNRNLVACGCRQNAADDRWAALKQISKRP